MTEIETICPECGRPRGPLSSPAGPVTAHPAGASRRGGVFAAAVILVAVAAVWSLGPGDDPIAEGPVSDDPAADDPVSQAPVSQAPVSEDGSSEAPVSEAPVPESLAPLPPAPGASGDPRERTLSDLTLPDGTHVAYASADGLVIVDTRARTVERAGVALVSPELAYADPFILVADDRRTLAVHPAAPDEPFVLATNYRLVATAVPEQYVFVPAATGIAEADEVFLGQAQDGSFGRPVSLPPGSRRLAATGVGMFVAGPGGATYEVGFGGLRPLTDANVIAAAGRHRLEVRCDPQVVCRTDVVDDLGASVAVADDVAGRLGSPMLSTDGEWVAGRNGRTIVIVEVGSGEVVEVEVEDAILALAWAPEGDVLVGLVGPRDDARLVVVPVRPEREPSVVDLGPLGAPAPVGSSVVVF